MVRAFSKGESMKVVSSRAVLVVLALTFLVSCNEDKKCSDEFVLSYQRMGDAFEKLYEPLSGSFELNVLSESIDLFLASHKNVSCDYQGKTINPTTEAEAMKSQINSMAVVEFAKAFPKVIYGEDNRKDVSDSLPKYREWAGSTLVQMSSDEWDQNFNFTSKTYGEEFRLCSGERFENQLSGGRCSGFLVAPDIVVTAGHCMQDQSDCDNFKWLLDYKDNAQSTSSDKIFGCQEIIKQVLDSQSELDYAVVKLDRAVTGRKFFKIRGSGTVAVNTPLVLIGYPSGISAKVADGAIVRSNSATHFFKTNTDSFGGNSGSAVINQQTGVVEGILVRGDQDFDIVDAPDGSRCRVERNCANDGCEGEEVTKMTSVEGIPVIGDPEAVRKGLYTDKNFPSLKLGLPIEFLSYSYQSLSLGGVKFLDRCGIHYFNSNDPEHWLGFHKGLCSETADIDQVIGAFSNNFYL